MPKFEIVYKIQKTYRMVVEAKDEDEAEEKAVTTGLTDNFAFRLYPSDAWVSSISQIDEEGD